MHQKPLNNKSDYINDLDSEPNAMQTEIIKTYPNMDDQVNYWSDYLRMKLNPRSILLLDSQYNIDWYIFVTSTFKYFSNQIKCQAFVFCSHTEPFDLHQYGLSASKEPGFMDDYENRLRLSHS